jgi:hypothetical protein
MPKPADLEMDETKRRIFYALQLGELAQPLGR